MLSFVGRFSLIQSVLNWRSGSTALSFLVRPAILSSVESLLHFGDIYSVLCREVVTLSEFHCPAYSLAFSKPDTIVL